MATNSSIKDAVTTSVRLGVPDYGFVEALAEATGVSFNAAVRQLVGDVRTFYGLPDNLRQLLEDDAKELKKNHREYLLHLVGLRAEELLSRRLSGTKRK